MPSSPRFPSTSAARAAIAATVTLAGLVITGCSLPVMAQDSQDLDPGPPTATFDYVGAQQGTYVVPAGVNSVTITARGGSGGNTEAANLSAPGALVTGTIVVQPGDTLLVNVGGDGESVTSSDHDPQGGWGGLGASGGNGNAASDDLRSGAAGGGATTIQLVDTYGDNPYTLMVAGGGGGAGGASGDAIDAALGGGAGCTGADHTGGKVGAVSLTPNWLGSSGENGSPGSGGGKGGAAGGESRPAGGRGQGGSGLGGNGGGGGGGVNGGNPGSGASTSAAGGGGAGSSATYSMTNTSVTCAVNSQSVGIGDGQAVIVPSAE